MTDCEIEDSHLDLNDLDEIDTFPVVVCGSLRRGATRGVTIHPGHTVEAVCGPGRSRWHHNVTSRCLRLSSPPLSNREINRSIFSMTTCSKISALIYVSALRMISVSRAVLYLYIYIYIYRVYSHFISKYLDNYLQVLYFVWFVSMDYQYPRLTIYL